MPQNILIRSFVAAAIALTAASGAKAGNEACMTIGGVAIPNFLQKETNR